jgi:hypothetical protein
MADSLASLLRSSTDIKWSGAGLPSEDWKRERSFMKTLGICLCIAFTVWMVACGLLLIYSGEIARFIVGHSA